MQLQPIYQTFNNLLPNYLFRIPDYQRPYSWVSKQRQDLFQDITNILRYEDNRHHFISTVVTVSTQEYETLGSSQYSIVDIVDGQQRLTSIIILLKAISLHLSQKKKANLKSESKEIDSLLVKDNGRIILLSANHDSSQILRKYLSSGKHPSEAKSASDHNLISAFQESEVFVKEWEKNHGDLLLLLRIIKNRLGFIYYNLPDHSVVFTVFEVLNSRGLAVDWLDKVKSVLMQIIYENTDREAAREIANENLKIWKDIYHEIGIKNFSGTELLRFTATLINENEISKTLSAEDSMEAIKEYVNNRPEKVLDLSHKLKETAVILNTLYKNNVLNAVTSIAHARLLYVAIEANENLPRKDKNTLIEKWEKMTFKIFGLARKDSRTEVGNYTRLAYKIYNNFLESFSEILYAMNEIENDTKYSIDLIAEQIYRDSDCYTSWEKELRYLLYKYEQYLVNQSNSNLNEVSWSNIWNNTPHKTIEHIMPQTMNLFWKGKVGSGKDKYQNTINRIGNFTLLPGNKNSELSNSAFEEKKSVYKKSNLNIMQSIISEKDWDSITIDKRSRLIADFVKEHWK